MMALPAASPRLTQARAELTRSVEVVNQHGQTVSTAIPAERALTLYVDRRELVTLMTLGAQPELLVLGFLRNQRLLQSARQIESVTVDWDVGAAAVRTHGGVEGFEEKTAKRVVTTGCGQGSVFGELMGDLASVVLAPATLSQHELYAIVNTIRHTESVYKAAGSVHGCALFRGEQMLMFVEDVGRHNAIDTIAGWMWLQEDVAPTLATAPAPAHAGDASAALEVPPSEPAALRPVQDCAGSPGAAGLSPEGALAAWGGPAPLDVGMSGADKVFYTTGRLTSEMVIKSAQMGVPIIISRSGITQMGLEVARQIGLCAVGRATNRHFHCYSAPHRLRLQPALAGANLRAVA